MDASDIILKNASKVVYNDFKTNLSTTQSNPPCQPTTCDFSGCTVKYSDYQYRLLVKLGKAACNNNCC